MPEPKTIQDPALFREMSEPYSCTELGLSIPPPHAGYYPITTRTWVDKGMPFQAFRWQGQAREMEEVELEYYRCPHCRHRSELENLDIIGADKDCVFCGRCGLEFCLRDAPKVLLADGRRK